MNGGDEFFGKDQLRRATPLEVARGVAGLGAKAPAAVAAASSKAGGDNDSCDDEFENDASETVGPFGFFSPPGLGAAVGIWTGEEQSGKAQSSSGATTTNVTTPLCLYERVSGDNSLSAVLPSASSSSLSFTAGAAAAEDVSGSSSASLSFVAAKDPSLPSPPLLPSGRKRYALKCKGEGGEGAVVPASEALEVGGELTLCAWVAPSVELSQDNLPLQVDLDGFKLNHRAHR